MSRPVRLQLSRRPGFNLQRVSLATNGLPAVNVARPGRYGNPFPVGKAGPFGRFAPDNAGAAGLFRDMLGDPELRSRCGFPSDLGDLRGKNLACWCRLDEPCHADVLLELANGGPL